MSRNRDFWLDAIGHIDEEYVSETVYLHMKQEEKSSKTLWQRHGVKLAALAAAAAAVVFVVIGLVRGMGDADIVSPNDAQTVKVVSVSEEQFSMDYSIYSEYFDAMWSDGVCTVDYFSGDPVYTASRNLFGFSRIDGGALMLCERYNIDSHSYELWYVADDDKDTVYYAIDTDLSDVTFTEAAAKQRIGDTPADRELTWFYATMLMAQYDSGFTADNHYALIDMDKDGDDELLISCHSQSYAQYGDAREIFVFEGTPFDRTLDCHFSGRNLGYFETWHNTDSESGGYVFVMRSFSNSVMEGTYIAEIQPRNGSYQMEYMMSWGTLTWQDENGETVSRNFRRRGFDPTDTSIDSTTPELTQEEFDKLYSWYHERMDIEIKQENEVLIAPSGLEFSMDIDLYHSFNGIWSSASGDKIEISFYSDDAVNKEVLCTGFAEDENGVYMRAQRQESDKSMPDEFLWYIPSDDVAKMYKYWYRLGIDEGYMYDSEVYTKLDGDIIKAGRPLSWFGAQMTAYELSGGKEICDYRYVNIDKAGADELMVFYKGQYSGSEIFLTGSRLAEHSPYIICEPYSVCDLGYGIPDNEIHNLKIYNTSPDDEGEPFAIYISDNGIDIYEINKRGGTWQFDVNTMLGTYLYQVLPEYQAEQGQWKTAYYAHSDNPPPSTDGTTTVHITKERFFELLRTYTSKISCEGNAMPEVPWLEDYALLEEHFFGSWSDGGKNTVTFDYHEGSSFIDVIFGYGFGVCELEEGYFYFSEGGGGSVSYFIPRNEPDTMYMYSGGLTRQAELSKPDAVLKRKSAGGSSQLDGVLSELGMRRLYDEQGFDFYQMARSVVATAASDISFEEIRKAEFILESYDEQSAVIVFNVDEGIRWKRTYNFSKQNGLWQCTCSYTDENGSDTNVKWWIDTDGQLQSIRTHTVPETTTVGVLPLW